MHHHANGKIKEVVDLLGEHLSDREISRRTGVARSTVQRWRTRGLPLRRCGNCPIDWRPTSPASYSYLLGIYLGDGYISKASKSPVLEIALDARYPGIALECTEAIWQVSGVRSRASPRIAGEGKSIRIVAGSPLWPTAFPQHGPGKKHNRTISLKTWQTKIVADWPRQFLRGLIHSDGSRSINRVTANLSSGAREYVYVRYHFTNLSADIRGLFCDSCDQLGIRWTQSSYKNISVANRPSVELLDSFVGPKY